MQEINSNTFDKIIQNKDKKTVIKFFVDWCPDCKRVLKFEAELYDNFKDNFNFYSINADLNKKLKEQYGVRGYPSYLIFYNNEKLAHLHSKWAKTEKQITDYLNKNINGNYSQV